MPSKYKWPIVRGFELQDKLGDGGFAKVYRAVDYKINMVAACKVILLTKTTTTAQRKELHKEIKVHAQLDHVNILNFLGSMVIEDDGKTEFVPAVYMVLELASAGDLFDKIAPDYGVDDELAHFYFGQLLDALRYIHGIGVCHRDLKPENILLDAQGNLKLSDFGLCSVYKHKGQERTLNERCGSLPYVAPELNVKGPYRAEPVDVWGAGVILFTLLVGNTPWDEPTANSPEWLAYLSGEIFNMEPWNRIQGNALSLMKAILTVNPEDRITLIQIGDHPWCLRQSQIAKQGPTEIAERLSHSLRQTGDLEVAEPNFVNLASKDMDGDEVMMTATNASQFTKTLQLFSQTQNGARYDPHLTRFYARASPTELLRLIIVTITRFGLKHRLVKHADGEERDGAVKAMRIGGYDRRKEQFRGTIEVENFEWADGKGSRCVMKKDKGNPTEWRRLWKELIMSPEVDPYVLRKAQQ